MSKTAMTDASGGGAAFPLPASPTRPRESGMTLLDWFAGQAMASYLIDNEGGSLIDPEYVNPHTKTRLADTVATRSYAFAAAMLAERQRLTALGSGRGESDKGTLPT